jgi:hypothetical protein
LVVCRMELFSNSDIGLLSHETTADKEKRVFILI